MSSNQRVTYKLEELYNCSSGLSKGRKEFGFGYPFLTFKEVFNNYFLPDTLENLANTTDKEREKCSIKSGDIFLTRTSETQEELGMSSVALKDYPEATFNGFTKRLRLKKTVDVDILPEYIGYYLRSPKIRKQMSSFSSLTTRASLNNSMINQIEIELPSMSEQKHIANILSTLDEKIETNNVINQKLKEMAQTIFKQWFVDLEFPNEEGKPYKTSGGTMIESELGMIPKGWEICSIYELTDIIYGAPFKSKLFNEVGEGYPLIRIRDLKTKAPNFYTSEKHTKATLVNRGDILIGMDAEFTPTIWTGETALLNQRVLMMKPNKEYIHKYFMYESIKPYMRFFENAKTGTTVIHLGKADIDTVKIVNPGKRVLLDFSNLINPIYIQILDKAAENMILRKIRDTLLPKLMSGEVSVSMEEEACN
ncbi:restriction endonuclease subunit S [Bacillus paranthracis]|uniref:restriction endonuclease subunit S n=1 Tax=Bacillus paranthracis TaxID=2026186 RepID=UPI0013D88892|nr:restriction endonuclease subunit S [Bacillus paranthracis]MDK7446702.1 restriction endonuclease subunit S [Bacillus paranthracis]MDN8630701.1 restriction endonuclease subunit S [Bacillus paranthracis]MDN8637861.1 restriction endonuclease subunit S [Bacillus paranthracis]HDR7854642.1 restriction endonuclease subunit S [Bacillus paranthracis]